MVHTPLRPEAIGQAIGSRSPILAPWPSAWRVGRYGLSGSLYPVVVACHWPSGYGSALPAAGGRCPSAGLSAGWPDVDPARPASVAYPFRQRPVSERRSTPERSGPLRQAIPDRQRAEEDDRTAGSDRPRPMFMPSLVHMLDVLRNGEVAGRSPCPCVPSVDVDVMAWLRSLHGPLRTSYRQVRIRMPPTYVSGGIVGISPRKPCRRRRHFSPRMRVNRFVFLNLPMLKPREPSRRNSFASTPFTCGLRHPASWQQVTAAWAHAPSQQRARQSLGSSFLPCIPVICIPDPPGRGAL